MVPTKISCSIIVLIGISLILITTTEAAPSRPNSYYNDFEEVPDEVLVELIAKFGQTIMKARDDLENSKRTVDFGLARGFSGTQEAKHRMGMAAANFPGGPGRRRRSESEA